MREKDSCAGNYHQIMDNPISLSKLISVLANIFDQLLKIYEMEEQLVSLGQMNSLSSKQEVPISDLEPYGTVHGEKSGHPLGSDFLSKSRNIQHAQVEEVIRISMKHSTTSSGEKRITPEITGRCASWLATLGFVWCLISLMLSKPLLQPQGRHSLWLAIIGMFSFTLFVSAVSVMLVVGARFSQKQITVMLIAFFALLLA